MTDTFNFIVDTGTSATVKFSVKKTQFGDGYVQSVANGINNKVDQWNVSLTDIYADELAPVTAFLDAQQGFKSFYWTPPDGTQGLYRCEQYTVTPAQANLRSFTAVFDRVYAP